MANQEHRYECAHGHRWTTLPVERMRCPHCGTITLGRLKPLPEVEDRLAEVIWRWNMQHGKAPVLADFPYERLVEVTKDDLRELARRMLPEMEVVPLS